MISRRQLAAEVLLAHRLKNLLRIDDTTEIDTCYISCAEYQLFVDERLKLGEYHQPDHWTSTTFPKGSGAKPVAGIRPSDAKAFCEWLSARDTSHHYRLPLPKEVEENPVQLPAKPGLTGELFSSKVGTWCESDPPTVGGGNERTSVGLDSSSRARDRARALALALARARARDLDLDRYLARDRARYLALARDLDLARALDLDRARAIDRARDRALDLALALDRTRALARDLDLDRYLDLTRARDHALARARIRTLDRTRALDRDLDRDRALRISFAKESWAVMFAYVHEIYSLSTDKRNLADTLNNFGLVFVSLVILEERIAGHLPAWEGIRIVRERNPENEFAQFAN